MESLPTTPSEVAKQRLENYIHVKFQEYFHGYPSDKSVWEFYTFLLEKAKQHPIDTTGYGSFEYQDDEKEALNNRKILYPERYVPPKVRSRKPSRGKNLAIDESNLSSQAGVLA